MKPVNFIKNDEKENFRKKSNINKSILFLLPVLLILGLIAIDYLNLKKEISHVSDEIFVRDEEVMSLKMETEILEKMVLDLKNSQRFFTNLDKNAQKFDKIISLLDISSKLESNNIFLTSVSLEVTFTLIGNSLEKESVDNWIEILNENGGNFYIGELNFSNGFYTFILNEGGEVND